MVQILVYIHTKLKQIAATSNFQGGGGGMPPWRQGDCENHFADKLSSLPFMYVCQACVYICQACMHGLQACMYVCMYARNVCMPRMYVWTPSMYVCLLSVYVCLREIVLQKTRSDSLGKRSVFDVYFNLFEICEGGYFWRPQTYIHA